MHQKPCDNTSSVFTNFCKFASNIAYTNIFVFFTHIHFSRFSLCLVIFWLFTANELIYLNWATLKLNLETFQIFKQR